MARLVRLGAGLMVWLGTEYVSRSGAVKRHPLNQEYPSSPLSTSVRSSNHATEKNIDTRSVVVGHHAVPGT